MVEAAVIPPNQQLLQAREKAGWSVERVAFTLNLPVRNVLALEEGCYEALHGEAFVVAYIRSYARLFSLDAQQLVNLYRDQMHQQAHVESDEQLLTAVSARAQHKKYRTGYGVAAAVTLMAALSMLSPSADKAAAVMPADSLLIETRAGETLIESLDSLPENNPTLAMVPEIATRNLQPAVAMASVPEMADTLSELNFRFSADCWVEVFDGDNQRIYAALQKSDQALQLTGKPPFRITLGYAPGVELSYNGQPVRIDANDASMAKLVLGNS